MRLALLCALAALLLPAAALAHSTTSRVHNMREIALQQYGDACAEGTMAVPIIRTRLPRVVYPGGTFARQVLGRFSWVTEQDGRPWGGCKVEINDQRWTTEKLCTVIGHELGGHGTGWRAPPGAEYVYPDGTHDPLHSADPANLMYPFGPPPWAPCANGAARP